MVFTFSNIVRTSYVTWVHSLAVFILLLVGKVESLQAQLLKHTYILEAYGCDCSEDGDAHARKSIQLALRLDESNGLYTALNTLVGCSAYDVIIDKQRFRMTINLANAADNIAYLEPLSVGSSLRNFEKALKTVPKFGLTTGDVSVKSSPNLVILQGSKRTPQVRRLAGVMMAQKVLDGATRYQFQMPRQAESDVDIDQLVGGPVWFTDGGEALSGLIIQAKGSTKTIDIVVSAIDNAMNRKRYQMYHTFLKAIGSSSEECRDRNSYWDGVQRYGYKEPPAPEYKRINKEDNWQGALRNALLRIKEHMEGKIPTKAATGQPSLCFFANDLEYAYVAWVQKAGKVEQEDWLRLATFVKSYSNIYCKNQGPGRGQFDQDIITLNANLDRISEPEISLMLELGIGYNGIQDFTRENFTLSQVVAFADRCSRRLQDNVWISDLCAQRDLLAEMDEWMKAGSVFTSTRSHPSYPVIVERSKELKAIRKGMLNDKLVSMTSTGEELDGLLEELESDGCLTDVEYRAMLVHLTAANASARERLEMEHGYVLVDDISRDVKETLGQEAMNNVHMRVFRVKDGVGVEMMIAGGGSVVQRTTIKNVISASDTTSIYRKGYHLGSLGDTLATAVARHFWARICDDYADASSQFSPEALEIIGMADAVPVVRPIEYPSACAAQMSKRGLSDENERLAFARAWILSEQLFRSDPCGIFGDLRPTLEQEVSTERGGQYRGIKLRAVVKRL